MMRAEYEKQADLLVIELERNDRPSQGEWNEGRALIEYVDGHPVSVEFTAASVDLPDRIHFAAEQVGRAAGSLEVLANLAIDNPDSLVTLDLEVHTGTHL